MHEDLAGFQPVLRYVAAHSLEYIFELGRRLTVLVYLPEVLFVFVSQSLVIRVLRVRSSEGLKFHGEQE